MEKYVVYLATVTACESLLLSLAKLVALPVCLLRAFVCT